MSKRNDEPRVSGAKLMFARFRALLMIGAMAFLAMTANEMWEKLPDKVFLVMGGVAAAYLFFEFVAAIWQSISNRRPEARLTAHEENGPARFWLWTFNLLSVVGIGLMILSVFKGEGFWMGIGPGRIGSLIYKMVRGLVRWSLMAWPVTVVLHIIHHKLYRKAKDSDFDEYEDDYDDYDEDYDYPEDAAPAEDEPASEDYGEEDYSREEPRAGYQAEYEEAIPSGYREEEADPDFEEDETPRRSKGFDRRDREERPRRKHGRGSRKGDALDHMIEMDEAYED